MPEFVKTPKDEARWAKAKEAAGKETEHGSESYWKLSNYIFHKMGKTEEDQRLAKALGTKLMKPNIGSMEPKIGSQTANAAPPPIANPMKSGTSTSVKMPKSKKMADPFGKPSLLLKNQNSDEPKHASVRKLNEFLNKNKGKSNL